MSGRWRGGSFVVFFGDEVVMAGFLELFYLGFLTLTKVCDRW